MSVGCQPTTPGKLGLENKVWQEDTIVVQLTRFLTCPCRMQGRYAPSKLAEGMRRPSEMARIVEIESVVSVRYYISDRVHVSILLQVGQTLRYHRWDAGGSADQTFGTVRGRVVLHRTRQYIISLSKIRKDSETGEAQHIEREKKRED